MWLAYTRNLGNSQDKRDMDCYFKFSVVMKIKMYTNEKNPQLQQEFREKKNDWFMKNRMLKSAVH